MREDEKIQIIVRESVFNVRIDTEGPEHFEASDGWLESVWLRCVAATRAALDTLGFHLGAILEIQVLTAMVDDVGVVFFGSSQPRFQISDDLRVEGTSLRPYFSEAMRNPPFRHALADVRQAQRLDDDAAFYCYRAIEGLRQLFVRAGESETNDKAKSWERLRVALNVTVEEIGNIAEAAKARRHGGNDASEADARLKFVLLTRELVRRYVNQLPEPHADTEADTQL